MPVFDFDHQRINDTIHGSIGLSKVELKVIHTPTFQRLKNLKQLGLADLVFPGATHTRFAHSIGAMHVMSRMIDSIAAKDKDRSFPAHNDETKQKLRLAALLHDIGHYPLCHASEQVFQKIALDGSGKPELDEEEGSIKTPTVQRVMDPMCQKAKFKGVSHESYGRKVVERRQDLRNILKKYGFDPDEIAAIFTGQHPQNPVFSQLIHSTLDADRIDYLLRDSHHAGVPYGHIDIDYLLSSLIWNSEKKLVAVSHKGISSLEHYLLSRFFSYNITFHKTIQGFELIAKCVYLRMAQEELALADWDSLLAKTEDNDWFLRFHDGYFWDKLNLWKPEDQVYKYMKKALLFRYPLTLLYEERQLVTSEDPDVDSKFLVLKARLLDDSKDFASLTKQQGIKPEWLALHASCKTEIEGSPRNTKRDDKIDESVANQLGKVLVDYELKDLIDVDYSVVAKLSDWALHLRRLYFLDVEGINVDRQEFYTRLNSAPVS